jgi:hypothetical protein
VTAKQLKAYGVVMSIGSTNHSTTMLLAREIMATLPRKLWQAIDKWITSTKVVFPGNASWVCCCCVLYFMYIILT